jgi:hypothetical protein
LLVARKIDLAQEMGMPEDRQTVGMKAQHIKKFLNTNAY